MPRKFAKSFEFAFSGVWYLLTTQRNLRIHLIVGAGAVLLSILLHLSAIEFAVVVLVTFLVLVTEMLNTAIEESINLLIKQHDIHAKRAKDVAAAATLFSGICAIIIGCLIFAPKVFLLFR